MAITDIFKLRPTEQTSAAIREALNRATAADQHEQAELKRLEQERDSLLLDGSPATLKAAEIALATAKDSAGRVGTIRQQLEQRLVAAIERETVAEVEAARQVVEERTAAHAAWWSGARGKLVELLLRGSELANKGDDALGDWNRKVQAAQQKYPHLQLAFPAPHPEDPAGWREELQNAAMMGDFSYLSTWPRKPEPAAQPLSAAPSPPTPRRPVPIGHVVQGR